MKKLFYFVYCSFVLLMACGTHKHQIAKHLIPEFKNQGEQEDYWANKFFNDNYKKEDFQRYSGYIQLKGDILTYGKDTINIEDTSTLKSVFTSGLIFPKLFYCSKVKIGNLEEMPSTVHSIKIKRFDFWAFLPKMANPTVYIFELSNEKAKNKMSIAEFIKGAHLTFFKEGWIII